MIWKKKANVHFIKFFIIEFRIPDNYNKVIIKQINKKCELWKKLYLSS
jgi:hypothetical protein